MSSRLTTDMEIKFQFIASQVRFLESFHILNVPSIKQEILFNLYNVQ